MQYEQKATAIRAVIQNYFEGLYQGDVSKLKAIFAGTAYLYGDIKGVEYAKVADLGQASDPNSNGDILSDNVSGSITLPNKLG